MSNYIENIQVNSGASWPIRDAALTARVDAMTDTLTQHAATIEEMDGVVTTASETIQRLESDVTEALERVDGYLPLAGGSLTGIVLLLENVHYGAELPEAGTVGRPFLKRV